MIRSVAVGACCLALLAGSASAADPPPPATPTSAPALPADGDQAQPVKQVALDPTVPSPVCRRVAPTGSRIKNEVCETADSEKAREAERDQIRRDLDEMRARQAMRDQARSQALAEAMMRRR
jgi:hypothetical protein